jgi:acetyl esterase/lipase
MLGCALGGMVLGIGVLAQMADAQVTLPARTMGAADPKANPVLDAVAEGIRVLPPVRLYPNGGGGFETWQGRSPGAQEVVHPGVLYNVTDPSYQAFLPPAGRNTRTAVIVAPGGGFRQLSIDSEGNDVAKWLAARGIAAFTLKYRIVQQPGPNYSMTARMQEFDMDVSGAPGVADGAEAIKQIRSRAAEYGIDPDRIVFIGFSAGAHVAAYQALNTDVAARANYVAPIYGGPFGVLPEIPAARFPLPPGAPTAAPAPFTPPPTGPANPRALPPIFIAGSQDDFVAGSATARFYEALLKAGYGPEAHFFANGVHGYGLNQSTSSSRHWAEDFYWWLETQGLTRKPGDADLRYVPFRPPAPPAR